MDLWEKISASIRARVFGWSKTRWPELPITKEDQRFSNLMKSRIGDRYRAEAPVFGQCFKAVDEVDGTLVILKVLPDKPDGRRLLSHEFDVCSDLSHKNIIRYHDLLTVTGFTILVARLRDVSEFQSVAGPPPEVSLSRDPVGLGVFHQLQIGLDYLHARGWVHAGLGRESVVIDPQGKVTITNLMHCRKSGSGGTPAIDDHARLMHGSPEHLTGDLVPESDYFAVGILMFEYLLRRHPFWRNGLGRAFERIRSEGVDGYLVDPKLYNVDRAILGLLFSPKMVDRRCGWERLRALGARR
ncbi:MAG: protein kinase [Candidatus Latescibacterota bacterium]|nr:MAG: protein kinase [Candidatus Latescibacterota bacterium]